MLEEIHMEIERTVSGDTSGSICRATVRHHARETLSDQPGISSKPIKETVLEAMYRQHPEIGLEDVLELNALIPAPEGESTEGQINAVITNALEELGLISAGSTSTASNVEQVAAGPHGDR